MKYLTYQEANTEAQSLFASLEIGAIVSTPIADVKDNWPNLLFNITFSKGSKNFICQYRKGVGHVKWPVKFENIPLGTPADLIPVFNTLRQHPHAELKDKSSHARAAEVLARHQKVTAHPYEVFACVCDDAHTAHSMSFRDYCDNFGMNSDSIKAKLQYDACVEQYHELASLCSPEMILKFAELHCQF